MKNRINSAKILVQDDGTLILGDEDLIAMERDFSVQPFAGAGNSNCTNAGCGGSTNGVCQNNLCGGNSNSTCANIGSSCQDLNHWQF